MNTTRPPLPTVSTAHTLNHFLENNQQREDLNEFFTLENPQLLELNMNAQTVFAKVGSMVAFRGALKFVRESMFEHGLLFFIKKYLSGEGLSLMKISGSGRAYLADKARLVHVIHLENNGISVNGKDLLAFDSKLQYDIKMMKRIGGMLAGGLFNVQVRGSGKVAICTHGRPIVFKVTPGRPLVTDPQATVAWSSHLNPDFQVQFGLKTLIGRGSGEALRMVFEGDGWVLVQPFEQSPLLPRQG
jgi:uncharacterized protein (AIM24 family)